MHYYLYTITTVKESNYRDCNNSVGSNEFDW